MSAAAASGPITLCLGEALVELVGTDHAASPGEVVRFEPQLGGALAAVAAVAARAGAPVRLLAGAGEDDWGCWLRDRLEQAGVDLGPFALLAGVRTPLEFVAVHPGGEPEYRVYGEPREWVADALAGSIDGPARAADTLDASIDGAVRAADALLIGSATLIGARERGLTMRARELALELGRPVVLHCGLRLDRWATRAAAAASCNACVRGASLVCATQAEAEALTGEADPERAALALRKAGARMVAITLAPGAAVLRGAARADATSAAGSVVSQLGVAETFTGTLLARLAPAGFYPSAAATGLRQAAEQAAATAQRWGLDG
jgi:sugar/nucleoside kinase (ribokinase family)